MGKSYANIIHLSLIIGIIFLSIGAPYAHPIQIPSGIVEKGFLVLGADRVSISKEKGILTALGKVHLKYQGRKVEAGKIEYYYQKGFLVISEGVRLYDEEVEFSFERVEVDLKTQQSTFYNGSIYVKKEHLMVTAKRLEELSRDHFAVYDARFTTCDNCDKADWRIRIGKGKLTLGGYATGSNLVLEIRDKSFFWLPYAFFPAKTNRESGLLVPSFSSSVTKGTRLTVPIYLVTSGHTDLTTTFDYMSNRGVKTGGEFRLHLNDISKEVLEAHYINDRKFGGSRYRVRFDGNASGKFPFFLTGRIDYASDKGYYPDFEDDILLRTTRQVLTEISTGVEGKNYFFETSGSYIHDIQEVQDDRTTIQVIPSLLYQLKDKRLIPHIFGGSRIWVTNYYSRKDGSTQKGGASISGRMPFRLFEFLTFIGEMEFVDNLYYYKRDTGKRGYKNYLYWDTRGTIKTSLNKNYGISGETIVHKVEPYITIQDTKRIYGASPEKIDPFDNAPEKRRIIIGVGNRVNTLRESGQVEETGRIQVKYSYDFNRNVDLSSKLIDPFSDYFRTYQDQIDIAVDGGLTEDQRSDLYLDSYLKIGPYLDFLGEGFYDTKKGVLDKFSLGITYDNKKESYVSSTIRHTRRLATDLNINYNHRLFKWLRLKGWLNYSLKDSVIIENTSFFEYIPRSECWSATIGLSRKTRPAETTYSFYLSLRGLGSVGR